MEYEIIKYDFSKLTNAISDLTTECDHKRRTALSNIKTELNCFFTDFKCTEVLFTLNTDNDFALELLLVVNSIGIICPFLFWITKFTSAFPSDW